MSSPQPRTPRAVLTSLINTLTSAPRDPPPNARTSENALKSLPQSHRPLLVTLHVLFPSVVLPALDLLDRGLVTRVVRDDAQTADFTPGDDPAEDHPDSRQSPSASSSSSSLSSDHDAADRGTGRQTAGPNRREPAAFYLVRSVASTMSRRRKAADAADSGISSATTRYLVHLDAWNCTCANFAFEAFPAGGGSETEIFSADAEDVDDASSGWQFGGTSLDGIDRGGVPCCKHLLACLLAEQWAGVLGSYVAEGRMSRTAIAGTVGDM